MYRLPSSKLGIQVNMNHSNSISCVSTKACDRTKSLATAVVNNTIAMNIRDGTKF